MTFTTVEARKQISEVINRAAYGKERVILTRRGKPVVAVVPIEDVETLEALEDRFDIEEAHKVLAGTEKEGTVPFNEVKKELGLK
ncbi:MAG: type II toxin-antitoxin system Phd/YefM family antitoxin [Syntrophobacteraceae bacterium]